MRPLCFIWLLAAFTLLFVQCGKDHTPETLAMQSAQQSYDQLLAGNYEGFLAGRVDADSFPATYRNELLMAYKESHRQQESKNGGIRGITASRAVMDTAQHLVQVFMIIDYADSLKEEIVVPMVERNGEWKMK